MSFVYFVIPPSAATRTICVCAYAHLPVGVTAICVCVCAYLVAVLPARGGTGPRHLESFSENFECGRRGMCAQIKERKVNKKQSKERGWRVQEIDRYRQREGR